MQDEMPLLSQQVIAALEATLPRYARIIRRIVEGASEEERLTLPQYRCMQAIAEVQVTLTTRLAATMGVTLPTITSRIDGLVERGLVERQPDPTSRRQVQLRLTDAGGELFARVSWRVNARLHDLLALLADDHQRALLVALDDLARLLDADDTHDTKE